MAIASHTNDDRTFDRILAYTRDAILMDPNTTDHAFNHSPGVAIFFNQLLGQFGNVRMAGSAKESQMGAESVSVRMNFGKGNAGTLAGPYGVHGTDPTDTVRNTRATWKHYWANITVSDFEKLVNRGDEAIADMMQQETVLAMRSLADKLGDHLYTSTGASANITALDQIISAGDSVQGRSGTTHADFNARGDNGRGGTAPSAISFASNGVFADTGLSDMVTAFHNASEGTFTPNVITSDYASYEKYENSLQAQQRFNNNRLADGSFINLAFRDRPYMPDDKAPANSQWFLGVGHGIVFKVLEGADFTPQPFKAALNQEARVSEIQLKGQLVVKNRKYSNKITGIS